MPRAGLLVLASVLGALLPGCAEPEPAVHAYFPLVTGAHWHYEVESLEGPLRIEAVARGAHALRRGGEVFVVEETTRGGPEGLVEQAPVAYLRDAGHLARLAAVDWDGQGRLRVLGQDVPTWLLPMDAGGNAAWSQEHRLFATPEGGGALRRWTVVVRRGPEVRVPAGSFTDVLEVTTSYEDPDGGGAELVFVDSYARGVGLVRTRVTDPATGVRTLEQRLIRYRVPDR